MFNEHIVTNRVLDVVQPRTVMRDVTAMDVANE